MMFLIVAWYLSASGSASWATTVSSNAFSKSGAAASSRVFALWHKVCAVMQAFLLTLGVEVLSLMMCLHNSLRIIEHGVDVKMARAALKWKFVVSDLPSRAVLASAHGQHLGRSSYASARACDNMFFRAVARSPLVCLLGEIRILVSVIDAILSLSSISTAECSGFSSGDEPLYFSLFVAGSAMIGVDSG
jgi:hypothetical protein